MTVLDGTFLQSLSELHSVVQEALSSPNEGLHSADKNIPSLNSKGDVQQPFDLVVHEIVRNCRAVRRALHHVNQRAGFRVCEFSIQGNHYHLIIEATHRVALARGMQ